MKCAVSSSSDQCTFTDCAVPTSAIMFDQSACGQPGPVLVATVPSTALLLENELHHLEWVGTAGGGTPSRPDPGEPRPLPRPPTTGQPTISNRIISAPTVHLFTCFSCKFMQVAEGKVHSTVPGRVGGLLAARYGTSNLQP